MLDDVFVVCAENDVPQSELRVFIPVRLGIPHEASELARHGRVAAEIMEKIHQLMKFRIH